MLSRKLYQQKCRFMDHELRRIYESSSPNQTSLVLQGKKYYRSHKISLKFLIHSSKNCHTQTIFLAFHCNNILNLSRNHTLSFHFDASTYRLLQHSIDSHPYFQKRINRMSIKIWPNSKLL